MPQAILSVFLFILTIILATGLRKKFILWLPVYLIATDVSLAFFENALYITYPRALILISIFLIAMVYHRSWRSFGTILFFIYYIFLAFINPDLTNSLKIVSQIFASVFLLPIGYYYIKTRDDLRQMNHALLWVILIWAINVIISTIYKVGGEASERLGSIFFFGGLGATGGVSYIAFVIILLPLILPDIKSQRMRLIGLIATGFILIISFLVLKRMPLIIMIIAYMIYIVFNVIKFRGRIVAMIFGAFILVLFTLTEYSDLLQLRIMERGETRFQADFYKNEARYFESIALWNDVLSFKSAEESLIGQGPNSFVIETEVTEERIIHIDYNSITKSVGLIGLFLYLRILFLIIRHLRKHYHHNLDRSKVKMYYQMGVILLLLFVFAGFSGGHIHVTFRGIVFLYLGGIIGYLQQETLSPEEESTILEPTITEKTEQLPSSV